MKNIIILVLLWCSLIQSNVYSQLNKVNPDDIETAEKIKETYPEQRVASLLSSSRYSFEYNKKTEEVSAILEEEESILCLKELSGPFEKRIIYDDQTEVLRISGSDYKNKPISIYAKKTTYNTAGTFYDGLNQVVFEIPFSRIGDKNTYRYYKEFYDVKYLPRASFHNMYPIKEKVIEFMVPEWLDVELVEINFKNFNIKKTETLDKKNNRIISYKLIDIKPVEDDKLASAPTITLPHIILVSKNVNYNEQSVKLLNDVSDLYAWYKSLLKDMDNKTEDFKGKVTELCSSATSDLEKIENIFYWVQDNIKYLAYEDGIMGYKPANAQDVYNKKYGDCKGMANLTCEMLKLAGFDAHLTWIGTRNLPYDYSIPSLAVDNHMISTLYHNGNKYFLDATEKGIPLGDYAHRIQGQDVLVSNGESFTIDTIPEFDFDHNKLTTTLNLELKDNKLVGTGVREYTGEEKTILFNQFYYVSKLDIEKEMANEIGGSNRNVAVANIVSIGMENRNKPTVFTYDIEISNQVTELDKELYFNAEYHKNYVHLDANENRVNDLDFDLKFNRSKLVHIKVPENYSVNYIPKELLIDNDEFKFSLKYSFDPSENKLTYEKHIIIKKGMIQAQNIKHWNEALKFLNTFYRDQIILIKI
ncbi:MAG: transglutaminase-like domain-containing protein [Bacteroidales bacterium]|nr:transglutaminase-like domain-containing protein [Bacteroidales bacterium]MCF8454785.1 transglutaminase-like domain-containing protein [Bacteroidales bacterium]